MEGIRRDTREAIERLEGQVASLRAAVWILFLALAGAGGFVVWQQRHPKAAPSLLSVKGIVVEDGTGSAKALITARGISITDDQGQPRVELSLPDGGTARLVLSNAQGALRATPEALAMTDAKKDAAVLATAGGGTLQLRRADKIVVKQPYDAQDIK